MHKNHRLRCTSCRVAIPAAKAVAPKMITAGLVSLVGLAATRSWQGRLVSMGLGLIAVALVNEAARPFCGDCRLS